MKLLPIILLLLSIPANDLKQKKAPDHSVDISGVWQVNVFLTADNVGASVNIFFQNNEGEWLMMEGIHIRPNSALSAGFLVAEEFKRVKIEGAGKFKYRFELVRRKDPADGDK